MRGAPDPAILALIPAYNEAAHIGAVVTAARRYLPVVVVDDGSTDATAAVAATAGATVLSQYPNQGKGAALRIGFQHALAAGYEAVITLDADGQHDLDDIPRFLECYRTTQADLIIGVRDFGRMPPVRRLANTLGRLTFSWAVGQLIPDNQSGYRLLGRRLLERALAGRETGFEFEIEVIVLCLEAGYRLEWVPIHTIYADETSHIRPLHHVIHFTRLLWQTRRRMRRTHV